VLEVTTGSNDGTYGTLPFTDAGVSPINTIMLRQNNAAQSRLDITIVNNTGNNVSLASLNFDFNRANTTNSPQDMDVTNESGDLNVVAGTSVFSFSGNTGDVGFNNSDYTDVDATLTNLVDHKLADGESATFRIQVSNGVNSFNVRIDNIAIDGILAGTGTDYTTWIGGFGLFGSPDADADYDYDLDGWVNLMEYGLDGNPNGGTTSDVTVPSLESVGGTLKYIHLQRNNDASLSYYPELSGDLVTTSWTNSGYTVLGTNTTLEGEFDVVTNAIPTTANGKFIRLIIKQN